ncbi:cuticlin-1-like isoform X2 [Varroa jacobsoni]|uniref:cuticlin-1-like isoform X2 n=1 Tax=Varroa jacobsoni TaxID=62625 RepID=UPI000BF5C660|nr:cuticlin-1-like isoform X2 [Varroa jacobsoni]
MMFGRNFSVQSLSGIMTAKRRHLLQEMMFLSLIVATHRALVVGQEGSVTEIPTPDSLVVTSGTTQAPRPLPGIDIECNSNTIQITLGQQHNFNGMIYPKGLSKNSSCMVEYSNVRDKLVYTLPLRSCNTMSTDVDDGVEYFNTVVVQPHRKLVTNQGKGFHIRCRYQTKERQVTNNFNVSQLGTTPLVATAPMPDCSMKIYVGDSEQEVVAENVKIGDPLTLVINIDLQDVYGMRVTNCVVRDGLNWGEQPLINNEGCPIDTDIMDAFEYSENKTKAMVTFQAHKFPYTASVYYQCNVKLCLKSSGGCDDVPPNCDSQLNGLLLPSRKRRDVGTVRDLEGVEADVRDMNIEVFSGLYVNEASDSDQPEAAAAPSTSASSQFDFCLSTRKFAIGIAVLGLLLMLVVMLLVACILHRRRRKQVSSVASSVYSGHPYSSSAQSTYSNRAYSH